MEHLVDIPGGPAAAGAARDAVSEFDPALPQLLADDVRLLISEVVTNSVRHGGATLGNPVRVRITWGAGVVRVEVTDPGPGFTLPANPTPRPDHTGGWGLLLIDRIATHWGLKRGDDTTVWFEIDTRSERGSDQNRRARISA